MVWDNTQLNARPRHYGKDSKATKHIWANAFAAKNRVQVPSTESSDSIIAAKDLPLTTFLPSEDDRKHLRSRMETIVSRVITMHISHFNKHYRSLVNWHIPHQFSKESAQKSELVIVFQNF